MGGFKARSLAQVDDRNQKLENKFGRSAARPGTRPAAQSSSSSQGTMLWNKRIERVQKTICQHQSSLMKFCSWMAACALHSIVPSEGRRVDPALWVGGSVREKSAPPGTAPDVPRGHCVWHVCRNTPIHHQHSLLLAKTERQSVDSCSRCTMVTIVPTDTAAQR